MKMKDKLFECLFASFLIFVQGVYLALTFILAICLPDMISNNTLSCLVSVLLWMYTILSSFIFIAFTVICIKCMFTKTK